MLEDADVSRLLMKRMKITGEMADPWGTSALMECNKKVLSMPPQNAVAGDGSSLARGSLMLDTTT